MAIWGATSKPVLSDRMLQYGCSNGPQLLVVNHQISATLGIEIYARYT